MPVEERSSKLVRTVTNLAVMLAYVIILWHLHILIH